jgi:hypothetical protein
MPDTPSNAPTKDSGNDKAPATQESQAQATQESQTQVAQEGSQVPAVQDSQAQAAQEDPQVQRDVETLTNALRQLEKANIDPSATGRFFDNRKKEDEARRRGE